jgi:membrane protein
MMNAIREFFSLLKQAFDEFNQDGAPRLAAALSYFTIFSIAPLLIVVIAVAGLAFGQDAVRGQLDDQIEGLVGAEGASIVQELVQNANRPNQGTIAAIIGVVTLLLGAGGAFGQLQDSLNIAWGVKPPNRGIWGTIRARFLSFSMVLGVGFLLLVSLVLSAIISGVQNFLSDMLPTGGVLLQIGNQALSFGVIMVMFAMIFKFLPDTKVEWRDVWVGAAFTAALFSIGKYLIGLYLGSSGVSSSYGAAGSLVIILLWIFYSAQIFLFGAEFTQVYARRHGSKIGEDAAIVSAKDAAAESRSKIVVRQPDAAPSLGQYSPAPSIPTRDRRLLTMGLLSYLGTLVGLLVMVKRRNKS